MPADLGVNVGNKVDSGAETRFTICMNRNSNLVTTVTLRNGQEVTFTHRNSLMGWVNALERLGVDPNEVVSEVAGLPESARVR